jgi:hypothetical protein
VQVDLRLFGERDARTLKAKGRLANVLNWEGKGPEAEALCREMEKVATGVWGPNNAETLIAAKNLAFALMIQDTPEKLDEVEQITRRHLKAWLNTPEVNPYRVGQCRLTLGCVFRGQGRWPQAERELKQARQSLRGAFEEESPYSLRLQCILGAVLERPVSMPRPVRSYVRPWTACAR